MGFIRDTLGDIAINIEFAPALIYTGARAKKYEIQENRKDKKLFNETCDLRSKEEDKQTKKDIKDMSEVLMDRYDGVKSAEGVDKFKLKKRATRTLQLIDYTYYCVTTPEPRRIKLDRQDRRFVNAIAERLGYNDVAISKGAKPYIFRIDPLVKYNDEIIDEKPIDLYEYDPDPDNVRFNIKSDYILDLKDLDARITDNLKEAMVKKIDEENARAEERAKNAAEEATENQPEEEFPEDEEVKAEEPKPETKGRVDEEGIIHPDFTIKKDEESVRSEEVKPTPEATTDTEKKPEEKKVIHPIFTVNNENKDNIIPFPEFPKYGKDIPEKDIEKLKQFDTLGLTGNHRFEKIYDNIWIFLKRTYGIEDKYLVDTGDIMGKGEVSVLVDAVGDSSVFVSFKHPDLLKTVLETSFYRLTPNETQVAIADCFYNTENYRYIDMSNTEFLADLSKDDYQKLGKKLTFILKKVQEQSNPTMDLPRFRFKEWKSLDDFTIISDNHIKSPLMNMGRTSSLVVDGLTFRVSKDTVIEDYKGKTIQHQIEYGPM